MSDPTPLRIDVAGDVCLDLVGIPIPPQKPTAVANNWQLTGETRTYYLPGGAMLLAHWIDKATPDHVQVRPMRPLMPAELAGPPAVNTPLSPEQFMAIAERLTRDEVVHSLLQLDHFKTKPDDKKKEQIRIAKQLGFSGPQKRDPKLTWLPPDSDQGAANLLVLDDTGNRFRRTDTQWPAAVTKPGTASLVFYKLHRPLPGTVDANRVPVKNPLWEAVCQHYPDQRVVIISVDDLRERDAPISRGLSWERTALDVVWQLLNVDQFAQLRDCPHLIVRLGLDGAIYWSRRKVKENGKEVDPDVDGYRAWLIYDPQGIEGTGAAKCEGDMVGYGSAFTAALVKHFALGAPKTCGQVVNREVKDGKVEEKIDDRLRDGIMAGLLASRRLRREGLGNEVNEKAQWEDAEKHKQEKNQSEPQKEFKFEPHYPDAALFKARDPKKDDYFACQLIPIIPYAATADRGYWRLLDSIFANQTDLLHRAVALTATKAKPVDDDDDKKADALLRQVPLAVYKGLRTYDRREIENYRALYALMSDYVQKVAPPRPLSIAVFGPPGAGKSFGVKQVAKALGEAGLERPIEALTFNLSQYQEPDQLADAFHLVRDVVLQGKIPLVFFDEFDTSLAGVQLGWLRYFLAPMQDAKFLDRGSPHPIGQAIFVFAGGTCATYAEFARPFLELPEDDDERKKFKTAKGPDFLSRLRGTLDIPGLDLNPSFDPYGPVDAFPCEAAILLRRAGILAFQLGEKAPKLADSSGAFPISPSVLRALLHMPKFAHGNRSFEAILDMSRLQSANKFTPSVLPGMKHLELHADADQFGQLLGTEYPFPHKERELVAQSIHRSYLAQRMKEIPPPDPVNDASVHDWNDLSKELRESNCKQADDVAVKLRKAGLWFRKQMPGSAPDPSVQQKLEAIVETLAISEHDRWVAEKRRQGWIAAPGKERSQRNDTLRLHNCLFRWEELDEPTRDLDRTPVREIPTHLAAAGYEIVRM